MIATLPHSCWCHGRERDFFFFLFWRVNYVIKSFSWQPLSHGEGKGKLHPFQRGAEAGESSDSDSILSDFGPDDKEVSSIFSTLYLNLASAAYWKKLWMFFLCLRVAWAKNLTLPVLTNITHFIDDKFISTCVSVIPTQIPEERKEE